MKRTFCHPISLIDARTRKRVRVAAAPVAPTPGSKAVRVTTIQPGAALVPVCQPLPILGYWFRQVGALSCLTVYVPGTMPMAMRSAAEAGRLQEETWLAPLPAGVLEIDLTDCRGDFHLLQPETPVLAMYPTAGETSEALAA